VTATIASFFIGRDAQDTNAEVAGSNQIESLRAEIRELRELIEKKSHET
jgi:voltage-gated potassium channel